MKELSRTIEAQAAVLRSVLSLDIEAASLRLASARRVWLVGTGTSQHAAELGAQMLGAAGVDARWSSAAGFVHRRWSLYPDDAVVLLTHTGETAFARRVRAHVLRSGLSLVSITGDGTGWQEAIEVAPRETSETYTGSYTAALIALARLAGRLGAEAFGTAALQATVEAADDARGRPLAVQLDGSERLVAIVGHGPGAVTAREGALKLREAARVLSEGFEAEYLLHGSAVPMRAGDALILLQPLDDADGLLPAVGDAARASGIRVAEVSVAAALDPLLLQIPLTVRLQVLALAAATQQGTDPDRAITGAWADDRLWDIGAST